MSQLFIKIVNMSISASWLVLAILLLRFVLKKAPKWVSVLLWGIVAVRLLCPFPVESALSLIPSAEPVSPDIMTDWTPEIQTGVPGINSALNPVLNEMFAPEPMARANPLQIWIPVGSAVWLIGVAVMLVYVVVSFWMLRQKVATAVLVRDRIFQSEYVKSPFVLGVLKPRIYLPFHMDADALPHVIAHEQAHIRRKDHWWKPLGFLLLAVHWFNPFMWVAYILLCRDIELACDESVIGGLNSGEKAAYTQALVDCSVKRRMISACPLAFGEVGVKERVKSVMQYRKPAFWVLLLSVLICGAVAVCFLTNPKENGAEDLRPIASDEQKEVEENSSDEITETTYLYYPDGTVKEMAEQKGEEFRRTKYREDGTVSLVHRENEDFTADEVYNEEGKYIKWIAEYSGGKQEEITYDSKGRMLTWKVTFSNKVKSLWESSYYDNGNTKYIYHKESLGFDPVVHETERYFNEDGSPAAEYTRCLGYEGILTAPSQEISKETTYDGDGNRTTKILYLSGKIWETKHDAAGTRIWEKNIQPDGSTTEVYYGDGVISRYFVNGEEMKVVDS